MQGITRGEDGFHCNLGGTCNSGSCSEAPELELTLPPCSPQENGGEPRSNSVSESPSSPAPLAASSSSSETHSEVGLRMLGKAGEWDLGCTPSMGLCRGHTVGLTLPLTPSLTHRRMTDAIQHPAPSWTSTSRWPWPRSGRARTAPAGGHPRWTGARKMNCSATCEGPQAG